MVEKTKRDAILVYTGQLARRLLKEGYKIIDIKADRNNKERTIFIFKNENGLEAKIRELTYKSNS